MCKLQEIEVSGTIAVVDASGQGGLLYQAYIFNIIHRKRPDNGCCRDRYSRTSK